jgi:hypothetical protein
MWLLLIIILGAEPPYGHRGTVMNFYTKESQCREELAKAMQALYLSKTQVTGRCEFRDYLTPKSTF